MNVLTLLSLHGLSTTGYKLTNLLVYYRLTSSLRLFYRLSLQEMALKICSPMIYSFSTNVFIGGEGRRCSPEALPAVVHSRVPCCGRNRVFSFMSHRASSLCHVPLCVSSCTFFMSRSSFMSTLVFALYHVPLLCQLWHLLYVTSILYVDFVFYFW